MDATRRRHRFVTTTATAVAALEVALRCFRKDFAQCADHEVDVVARGDERGRQLDDGIASVVRTAYETTMEHLGRYETSQEALGVVTLPRLLGLLILDQLHAPEVTGPSDVAPDGDVLELIEARLEVVLVGHDVVEDVLSFDDADAGEGDRRRQRVTGPGESVLEGSIAFEEGLGQTVRDDHRAEGSVTSRNALGTGDDVGNEVVLLATEPGAKSPKGADHFVRDEDDAIPVTDGTDLLPVARGRREAATGVLNGLEAYR